MTKRHRRFRLGQRRSCRPWVAMSAALTLTSVSVLLPVPAQATGTDTLRSAVDQARAGTSCGPLTPNPIVEEVAAKINQSTQDYLNHEAHQIPTTEPLSGLKILGYPGSKGALIQGANRDDALAITALLLQGYDKIPDCSYTDVGVDMRWNQASGYALTAVVLAGA